MDCRLPRPNLLPSRLLLCTQRWGAAKKEWWESKTDPVIIFSENFLCFVVALRFAIVCGVVIRLVVGMCIRRLCRRDGKVRGWLS